MSSATCPDALRSGGVCATTTSAGMSCERISDIVAGRSAPLIEERIVRLDGQVRDVEVVAASFPDEDGVAIQVILRDITDRKRAEAALMDSEHRARIRAAVSTPGTRLRDPRRAPGQTSRS
jgi:PAS domain-containing protein